MGLIPNPSNSTDDDDDISNFSLEIEMLNKLHVDKNNPNQLSELPVLYDHLMPDPDVPLYNELKTGKTQLAWQLDERPRIYFRDPVTKTQNQFRSKDPANHNNYYCYYEGENGGDNAAYYLNNKYFESVGSDECVGGAGGGNQGCHHHLDNSSSPTPFQQFEEECMKCKAER